MMEFSLECLHNSVRKVGMLLRKVVPYILEHRRVHPDRPATSKKVLLRV
jgi:hypothetical protein